MLSMNKVLISLLHNYFDIVNNSKKSFVFSFDFPSRLIRSVLQNTGESFSSSQGPHLIPIVIEVLLFGRPLVTSSSQWILSLLT